MFVITFALEKGDLTLKTESRNLARSAKLLADENGILCEVLEEVKPRPIKFRAVD